MAPTTLTTEIQGDGPAVLMIHGLGGTSNFYQIQTDALTDFHTVIRPDLAGAGRSPLPDTAAVSIASHVADLIALLDDLKVDRAAVIGHSMGTLVARELAATHPDRITKVVLLGAVAEPTDAGRQAQRDRAATLRAQGTGVVAPGVVANALSERTRQDNPLAAALVRELVMRQPAEGYAQNCEALAAAGAPAPVNPATPLLLITGTEDKVGPAAVSEELAQAHGNASVHVIDGIGHWTALEAPAEVSRLLRDFL
ncbi:alpha/beta fold hydrolase [Granulicoccus phenolivorans]|uniref:alpha/beta fold hydrolase n=1 Tax=Granulicoccus phenolivorans TaxID=266854 RepID=UPI0003F8D582|nr:alpha/beta hydrolase [Granulicoccus phenolivorans]